MSEFPLGLVGWPVVVSNVCGIFPSQHAANLALEALGFKAIAVSGVVEMGKWSVHGGWELGCVMQCVMRLQSLLLQKTLLGHVRFLVCVVQRVGVSLGSVMVIL